MPHVMFWSHRFSLKFICLHAFVCARSEVAITASCADLESFVEGGPTLTTFFFFFKLFLVYEGRGDPNTT